MVVNNNIFWCFMPTSPPHVSPKKKKNSPSDYLPIFFWKWAISSVIAKAMVMIVEKLL